jgi:magnesium-transporting ATPase (P-type)
MLENKLKSDTKDVISNLIEANLIVKMISGDNVLTCV